MLTTGAAVPGNVYDSPGTCTLQVVANGIAPDPVLFYGPAWVDFSYTNPFGFYFGTWSDPYNTLADGVSAVASGGTIAIKPGASHETMTISKPMTITAIGGDATVSH